MDRTLFRLGIFGICAFLLAIGGCASQSTRPVASVTQTALFHSAVPAPPIPADDPIRTLSQYQEAVKAAQNALPDTLTPAYGKSRLLAGVAALAKLPSAPSRRYTAALIGVLKKHQIQPAEMPPSAVPPAAISYAELAQLEAITRAMLDSSYAAPEGQKPDTPYALREELFTTVLAQCPSDSFAVDVAMIAPRRESPSGLLDLLKRRAESRAMLDTMYARILDPRRPHTIPSLLLFSKWGDPYQEDLGYAFLHYGFTVDSTDGKVFADFAAGLKSAATRAATLAESAETRELLAAFDRRLKSPEIVKLIPAFDAKTNLALDSAAAIRQLLVALRDNDQRTLAKLVEPEMLPTLSAEREKMAGTLPANLQFQVVGNFFSDDADSVSVYYSSPKLPQGHGATIHLRIKRTGAGMAFCSIQYMSGKF